MMAHYLVTWQIDVEVDNATEAAWDAYSTIKGINIYRRDSATVFLVENKDDGVTTSIDLYAGPK